MSSLSTDNSSVWGAKGQAEVRLRSNPKGPGKTIARGNWDPEAVHWGGMLPRTEERIVHQELKLNPPDPPVLEGLGRFRVCSGRWRGDGKWQIGDATSSSWKLRILSYLHCPGQGTCKTYLPCS